MRAHGSHEAVWGVGGYCIRETPSHIKFNVATCAQALLAAVTSGSKKFFLGTDSAPHATTAKHSECGCAGVFTAHAPLELYAEAFDSAGALDHLEAFACHNGADFYGLPRHQGTGVTLVRKPTPVPKTYAFGPGELVPLRAGGQVAWARE